METNIADDNGASKADGAGIVVEQVNSEQGGKLRIGELCAKDVGQLITLNCQVIGAGAVCLRLDSALFECVGCGTKVSVPQGRGRIVKPLKCEHPGCGRKTFRLKQHESTSKSFQFIKVGELLKDMPEGVTPKTIEVELTGDICGKIMPGSRIWITGRVQEAEILLGKGARTQECYLELVCAGIEKVEPRLSSAEITELEERAKKPEYMDILVKAFAPNLHGLLDVKEALLLQMVSNGCHTNTENNTTIRDFIHVALVGESGSAKSSLKMAMKGYDPDIVLSSGVGRASAGLSADFVKDKLFDGYRVDLGPLPLADGHGVVIEEFDDLSPTDTRRLNEALDECRFVVSKAGVNMDLWARCWICATMSKRVSNDIMSRFDLMITLPGAGQTARDETQVGYSMLAARGIEPVVADDSGSPGETEPNLLTQKFVQEHMRKLIAHARTIKPTFQKVTGDMIHDYFVSDRKIGGTVMATPRQIESLIRLAKCEAQLHLSPVVTPYHLERAIRVLRSSMANRAK